MCCKEEEQEEKMYVAESFILRASIVLGMVAAVVTILYFSPMPDDFFRSCDRPCHDLDWPMICRVKITIEPYKITSDDCPLGNQTHCDIIRGGMQNAVVSTNNLLPGPSIQVCQNDVLLVDVVNKLPGHGVSVHWRGQPQNEAPYMDGAPMVTQCPISSYTTFQYRFRASSEGTHMWHAHGGSEMADGIFGALIVRRSRKLDPQKKLYDYDEKKHVIVISEWSSGSVTNLSSRVQKPKGLLINGKNSENPHSFEVLYGRNYRFRVVYGGAISECPVRITVDKHKLKVIALDGISVVPFTVDTVEIGRGERLDFVLDTKQDYGHYEIKISSSCDDLKLQTRGVLAYVGGYQKARSRRIGVNDEGTVLLTTRPCGITADTICLNEMKGTKNMVNSLQAKVVDRAFYLNIDYVSVANFKDSNKIYRLNNITFTYPSSPLLTQMDDVAEDSICSSTHVPPKCNQSEICECTHVEHIDLGTTVELLLIDGGTGAFENNFHLHGHAFYVVASRVFEKPLSVEEIKALDAEGALFERNLENAVQKDTIRVPRNSVVAVRFVADNPGFWMLRDGNSNQWTRGADMVFHVGDETDLPAPPLNFPSCGSWVGPDFFLL